MDTHKNARLTPKVESICFVRSVLRYEQDHSALQFITSTKTVGKWIARFRADGLDGLRDRSSRPLSSPSQIPLAMADAAESLRRQRCTQEQIAVQLGISKASVSRILDRRGLSPLVGAGAAAAPPRYERASPGEIIHIDIKKLGRFNRIGHRITRQVVGHSATGRPGSEFVHVAIDDHTRIAMARIFPDEKKKNAVAFLSRRRLLSKPRHHRQPYHDLQLLTLSRQSIRASLPAPQHQAAQDPALYPAEQWKGRALHPNRAARVGLRKSLQHLR